MTIKTETLAQPRRYFLSKHIHTVLAGISTELDDRINLLVTNKLFLQANPDEQLAMVSNISHNHLADHGLWLHRNAQTGRGVLARIDNDHSFNFPYSQFGKPTRHHTTYVVEDVRGKYAEDLSSFGNFFPNYTVIWKKEARNFAGSVNSLNKRISVPKSHSERPPRWLRQLVSRVVDRNDLSKDVLHERIADDVNNFVFNCIYRDGIPTHMNNYPIGREEEIHVATQFATIVRSSHPALHLLMPGLYADRSIKTGEELPDTYRAFIDGLSTALETTRGDYEGVMKLLVAQSDDDLRDAAERAFQAKFGLNLTRNTVEDILAEANQHFIRLNVARMQLQEMGLSAG